MSDESNEWSRACTSCDCTPTTTHTTVVPTVTVSSEGEKKCSAISIVTVPDAIVALAFGIGEDVAARVSTGVDDAAGRSVDAAGVDVQSEATIMASATAHLATIDLLIGRAIL